MSQKISIVRGLSTRAFGRIDVPGHADTANDSTPSCDSNIDAVDPGPADGRLATSHARWGCASSTAPRSSDPQTCNRSLHGKDPMYIATAILSILLAFVILVGQDLSLDLHDRGVVGWGPQTGTQTHLRRASVTHGPQPRAGPLHRSGRSIGGRGRTVGLFPRPLGIAATVGFAVLLIGAATFHARAGVYADPKPRTQAVTLIALLLVSAAVVILAPTMSPD